MIDYIEKRLRSDISTKDLNLEVIIERRLE